MLQQSQSLPMTTGGDINGVNANINAMAGMGQFDQTLNNVPLGSMEDANDTGMGLGGYDWWLLRV